MALVKEIRFTEGPLKGGVVRIYDDDYRDCSPEEIQRRRAECARVLEKWNDDRQRQEWRKLAENARKALETWPDGGEAWRAVTDALCAAPVERATEAEHVAGLMETMASQLLWLGVSPEDCRTLIEAARWALEHRQAAKAAVEVRDGKREGDAGRALPAMRAAAEGVSRQEKGRLRGGV